MNKEEIIARLMKGESMDDIMDELTDMVNAASAEATANQKAQEEKSRKQRELDDLAASIAEDINTYYNLVTGEDPYKPFEAEDIDTMIVGSMRLAKDLTLAFDKKEGKNLFFDLFGDIFSNH